MKIMIASDIHGSAYYCRKLMEAMDREAPDRLFLLGDILYHGPRNDLPQEYDPKAVSAMLNRRKDQILCVRGNCEAEVDQMMLEFPVLADYCFWTDGEQDVFVTHGHVYNLQHLPPLAPGQVLLHGHTHVPAWEPFGQGNYYLNPGSVSIPKNDTPRGYMIREKGSWIWKDLEGKVYHTL